MTRSFIIFGLFFFISCQNNQNCQNQGKTSVDSSSTECPATSPGGSEVPAPTPSPTPNPKPIENPTSAEVPPEAALFTANLQYTNFEADDIAKVQKAVEIIKKVVASQEFKDRVIGFTYNGQKTFVDNGGLTNVQIYQKLIDGAETLTPEVDNEMDLELELYYSSRNTVGYTYPNQPRIYMNTKYFYSYNPVQVAGNIYHEWIHKLGFDHASSYSVSRDSSVPYGVGYLLEELGKNY